MKQWAASRMGDRAGEDAVSQTPTRQMALGEAFGGTDPASIAWNPKTGYTDFATAPKTNRRCPAGLAGPGESQRKAAIAVPRVEA